MAKGAQHWKKYEDVQNYVRDLEDVYQIDVHMEFKSVPNGTEERLQVVSLRAWWKDATPWDDPMAIGVYTVKREPVALFITTMTRALVDFTYLCIEAKIGALSGSN